MTNRPNDSGGLTKFGISQKSNPDIDVASLTRAQAEEIYRQRYIYGPKLDRIGFGPLRDFLVDVGVMSSPSFAIAKLQRHLGVAQDGVLGPVTLAALGKVPPHGAVALVNKMVDDRVLGLARLVQKRPKDLENLYGWLVRTLTFRLS